MSHASAAPGSTQVDSVMLDGAACHTGTRVYSSLYMIAARASLALTQSLWTWQAPSCLRENEP